MRASNALAINLHSRLTLVRTPQVIGPWKEKMCDKTWVGVDWKWSGASWLWRSGWIVASLGDSMSVSLDGDFQCQIIVYRGISAWRSCRTCLHRNCCVAALGLVIWVHWIDGYVLGTVPFERMNCNVVILLSGPGAMICDDKFALDFEVKLENTWTFKVCSLFSWSNAIDWAL